MPPNLELFLVASLHGWFICAVILLAVSVSSAALLVGFSAGLLSTAALDLLSVVPIAAMCFDAAKANFELGFVLAMCLVMDCLVGFALALKPLSDHVFSEFRKSVRRLRTHIDALKLN